MTHRKYFFGHRSDSDSGKLLSIGAFLFSAYESTAIIRQEDKANAYLMCDNKRETDVLRGTFVLSFIHEKHNIDSITFALKNISREK